MTSDRCIYCGEELSVMERNRSECWMCQDQFSVTYSDDMLESELFNPHLPG